MKYEQLTLLTPEIDEALLQLRLQGVEAPDVSQEEFEKLSRASKEKPKKRKNPQQSKHSEKKRYSKETRALVYLLAISSLFLAGYMVTRQAEAMTELAPHQQSQSLSADGVWNYPILGEAPAYQSEWDRSKVEQ